jgi:CheY-like chemotaxis protein
MSTGDRELRRPRRPTADRPQLLVADDEPLCGAMIERVLRRDYEITVVTGGEEVLALIRAGHRYQLILCDLSMPRVNGEDVFRALGREAPEQAERLIFITGGASTEAAARFLESVADRVLYKPFDRIRLIEEVAERLAGFAPTRRAASSSS